MIATTNTITDTTTTIVTTDSGRPRPESGGAASPGSLDDDLGADRRVALRLRRRHGAA